MNKKELTEADIRTKFITPALLGADNSKWDLMTQIREEFYFTKGRVIVRGKNIRRGEAKKVDYLLYYKPNIPIAVIETKDNNHAVGEPVRPTPHSKLFGVSGSQVQRNAFSSWSTATTGCVRNRMIMCPRPCRQSITRSVLRPD